MNAYVTKKLCGSCFDKLRPCEKKGPGGICGSFICEGCGKKCDVRERHNAFLLKDRYEALMRSE